MLNLHIFGLEFENNIVIFEIVAKFGAKRKILKFGTKKCLIWVFMDWNLKIILFHLKLNLGSKVPYLGICWLEF